VRVCVCVALERGKNIVDGGRELELAKLVVIFYFEVAGVLSQLNVTDKVICNLTKLLLKSCNQ
jgi:hypothetical protein